MNTVVFPKSYIVWDTETTGLNFETCHITEIGAMLVIDGEVKEKRNWVLDNKCEIPDDIQKLTGITYDIVKAEGRDPTECVKEFFEFLKQGDVGGRYMPHVTHNGIRFDIPFMVQFSGKLVKATPDQHTAALRKFFATAIDTAVLYKAKKIGMPRHWDESFKQWGDRVMEKRSTAKYNVGITCEELGISVEGVTRHRASGDVLLTNEIYKKLVLV